MISYIIEVFIYNVVSISILAIWFSLLSKGLSQSQHPIRVVFIAVSVSLFSLTLISEMQLSAVDTQVFEYYGISAALSGFTSTECSSIFGTSVSQFPIECSPLSSSDRPPIWYLIFGYLYTIFEERTLFWIVFFEISSFLSIALVFIEKLFPKKVLETSIGFLLMFGFSYSFVYAQFAHFNYVFSAIYFAVLSVAYFSFQRDTLWICFSLLVLGSIRVETAVIAVSFSIWYFGFRSLRILFEESIVED